MLQSTKYIETPDWYLDHIGLIVSDFMYYPGQRDRGPVMSFIRCDRGRRPPTITHWLWRWARRTAMCTPPIRCATWTRSRRAANTCASWGITGRWGIGRHIQGSQIFDYWRDPDGFLVEHFSDGSMFDNTLEPGWAPFTASGLAQWGHRPPKIFSASPQAGSGSRTAVDSDRDP